MDAGESTVLDLEGGVRGKATTESRVNPHPMQRALAQVLIHWAVLPMVGLALASVIFFHQSAPTSGLPFDDSYISLLFARNLAEHGMLTFDGETASAGATSLLHVAVLAVPIKLGISPVRASLLLGVALQLGLVLAVYWLAWTIFRDRLSAALSAASVGVIGYLTMDALNGMETTLFLLLTTAAAAAFLGAKSERAYLAAGFIAALAILARPEGALLLVAMVAYDLLHPKHQAPVLSVTTARRLAFLAGPSAVALFALSMFYLSTTGDLTPGTATAKFLYFREFEWSLQQKADAVQGGIGGFLAPLAAWLVMAVFAVRRRETLLFAFFWILFIVMYFFMFPGGLKHYWFRYQHVFLPALAVFGSAGAVSLLRSQRLRGRDAVTAAVIGLVVLAAVWFQYNSARDRYVQDVGVNETRQVGLALWLREVLPRGQTIASHDIGTLGYYSEHEVIDLVGLVNPDVIAYHDGRRLRQYVDEVKPDYVVVFPSWERNFLRLGLREDSQLFEEVQRFGGGRPEPFVLYETHY